jgi:hypothetical protein
VPVSCSAAHVLSFVAPRQARGVCRCSAVLGVFYACLRPALLLLCCCTSACFLNMMMTDGDVYSCHVNPLVLLLLPTTECCTTSGQHSCQAWHSSVVLQMLICSCSPLRPLPAV